MLLEKVKLNRGSYHYLVLCSHRFHFNWRRTIRLCRYFYSRQRFKLFALFIWVKEMQQCFHVNIFVLLVPWKYETLSSIKIFFLELRGYFPPSPAGQNSFVSFTFVFVFVISTDNYYNIVPLQRQKQLKDLLNYRKWSNKRPLSFKRLLFDTRPLHFLKLALDAPLW